MGELKRKIQPHEDLSKIEDFSERITIFSRNTTFFWDVEDFPFPVGSRPDEIYEKIMLALYKIGYKGNSVVSIWAYIDDKNVSPWSVFLHNKTWDSRIFFIAAGDKSSRVSRMYNDILLWRSDVPLVNTDLIVIMDGVNHRKDSDNFFFYWMLKEMQLWSPMVVQLYTGPRKEPEDPEWPVDILYAHEWDYCDQDDV